MRDFVQDKFTIDDLFRQSMAAQEAPNAYTKMFSFLARFRHYSYYNTMLVHIQNPEVEFFGGKSFWRKRFNRTVQKGAKPYLILAPMSPVMLVYDLMDTDGDLTATEFLSKGLGGNPFVTKGTLDKTVLISLIESLSYFQIPVEEKTLSYFKAGYAEALKGNQHRIVLNNIQDHKVRFSTLLHEIAHILLGHLGERILVHQNGKTKWKIEGRTLPQEVMELEAETVSYLICSSIGLNTNSADYLSGYITSQESLLLVSYEQVVKVADRIEGMFR